MTDIGRAAEMITNAARNIRGALAELIQRNALIVEDCIREQLESGRDGNGKRLQPDYLSDPYFNKYGDKARVMAERYRNWKMRITPPTFGERLHLPERDPDTPNLRINGFYHDSITAAGIPTGVRIASRAPFGGEIDAKYGDDIYKMGEEARMYFRREIVEPALSQMLKA